MLNNFENCKKEIFTVGSNFKLYVVANYSFKNKDEMKLDPIYENTYNSSKYSDKDELSNLFIKSNSYLVFSYRENRNNEFINEDIYVSYPTLGALKDYLNQVAEDLIKNEKKYFKGKKLTETGDETSWESPAFAQGKTMAIAPTIIEREDFTSNGIILFIADEDNQVEIDLSTFITMVNIINDEFSLMIETDFAIVMNMLYEIFSVMNGNEISSSSSSITRSSNKFSRKSSPKNIFGNKKKFNKNVIKDDEEDEEEDNEEENNDEEEIEEEKPKKKINTSNKKSSNTKKVVKKVNKKELSKELDDEEESDDDEDDDPVISIKDAMKAAAETDIEDMDLDSLDD